MGGGPVQEPEEASVLRAAWSKKKEEKREVKVETQSCCRSLSHACLSSCAEPTFHPALNPQPYTYRPTMIPSIDLSQKNIAPTRSTAGWGRSIPRAWRSFLLVGSLWEKAGRMGRPCCTSCSSLSPMRSPHFLASAAQLGVTCCGQVAGMLTQQCC